MTPLEKFGPPLLRWIVYSPEHETYSADYVNPPEYGCDVLEIDAKSKRDAIILAVREFLKKPRSWAATNVSDQQPPWAGYKADGPFSEEDMREHD